MLFKNEYVRVHVALPERGGKTRFIAAHRNRQLRCYTNAAEVVVGASARCMHHILRLAFVYDSFGNWPKRTRGAGC